MSFVCSTCALELPEGARFCSKCGAAASLPADNHPVQSVAPPIYPQFFNPYPHLEGLSGWLIVVGLGLVLGPIRIVGLIYKVNLPFLLSHKNQPFLASHPATELLVSSEVVTNTLFVVLLLILNYLFFARKRTFPTWMIAYRILNLGLITINHFLCLAFASSSVSGKGGLSIAGSILGACILIPYLLVSRRGKATFTH